MKYECKTHFTVVASCSLNKLIFQLLLSVCVVHDQKYKYILKKKFDTTFMLQQYRSPAVHLFPMIPSELS